MCDLAIGMVQLKGSELFILLQLKLTFRSKFVLISFPAFSFADVDAHASIEEQFCEHAHHILTL